MRAESTTENKGSMLLEVLIAMAVLTLGISASVMLAFANQTLRVDAGTNSEALSMAASMLEAERADSVLDFALVNPYDPADTDIYDTKVDVILPDPSDPWTKQITSIVDWPGEGGRPLSIKLSTFVTDSEGPGGGSTCNSILSGDWTQPVKTEFEFGAEFIVDPSSGFPVTDIKAFNGKLYVTVNNDNGNNFQTFFIVDVSSPASPDYLSAIDTNALHRDGLNAVALDGGGYAYVANARDRNFNICAEGPNCSQLQIINVSDPENPGVETNLKLSASSAPYVTGNISGNNQQAVGKSIAYRDGYIYLGLSTTVNGPGFHIIDVHDPSDPEWVGSWPDSSPVFGSSGAPINAIYVRGDYAYLAHPSGLAGASADQLTVLDISDPANPERVSGFAYATGVGGNGKSLHVVGNEIYFGRTASNISGPSGDGIPEFFILQNIPTGIPGTPLGSKTYATEESVNGLIVRDYLAFLVVSGKFIILRIDDPSVITPYSAPLDLPPSPGGGGVSGTAADCQGNYIFIGSQGSNDKGWISAITAG